MSNINNEDENALAGAGSGFSFNFAMGDGDCAQVAADGNSRANSQAIAVKSSATSVASLSSVTAASLPSDAPCIYAVVAEDYVESHWGEVTCAFKAGDVVTIDWQTSTSVPLQLAVKRVHDGQAGLLHPSYLRPVESSADTESRPLTADASNSSVVFREMVWPSAASSSSSSSSSSAAVSASTAAVRPLAMQQAPLTLEPGLSAFCWPMHPTAFRRTVYRKRAFCVQSTGQRLGELKRELHNFDVDGLVHDATKITVWMKTKTGKMQYLDASADIAMSCYAAGHSLYFNPSVATQKLYINALCSDLGLDFGAAMLDNGPDGHGLGGDIEVFAVNGKHHTPWHFDGQENFTIQLVGTKRWSFAPSGISDPLTNMHPLSTNTAAIGDDQKVHRCYSQAELNPAKIEGLERECTTVVLRPGSVLYVPAGWWHRVIAEDEEGSLSINFSISGGRWADVFGKRLMQLLWQEPGWRERLTVPDNNTAAARDHLNGLISALPSLIAKACAGAPSPAHVFLPDGIFVNERAKKYIIHNDDATDGDDGKVAPSARDGVGAGSTAATGGRNGAASRKRRRQAAADEDADDDSDDAPAVDAEDIRSNVAITSNTIFTRSPISVMVVDGPLGWSAPAVAQLSTLGPSSDSSNSSSSLPSTSSVAGTSVTAADVRVSPHVFDGLPSLAAAPLRIELHSGFGSIGAETFTSDFSVSVSAPASLRAAARIIASLAPGQELNTSTLVGVRSRAQSLAIARRDSQPDSAAATAAEKAIPSGGSACTADTPPIASSLLQLLRVLLHCGYLIAKTTPAGS